MTAPGRGQEGFREALSDVSDFFLAPPSSLEGMLQRGTGDGFLAALEHPREGREAVMQCILRDPRWDCQLEYRAEYYASLVMHLDCDLEPLARFVRREDPASDEPDTCLAVRTIEALALQGHQQGLSLLREYFSFGQYWDSVVLTLASTAADNAPEVYDTLCKRLQGDEEADFCLFGVKEGEEPWASWAAGNPRIAMALHEAWRPRDRMPQWVQGRERSLSAIKTVQDALDLHEIRGSIRESAVGRVVRAEHLPVLVAALSSPDRWQQAIAVAGLGALANPAAMSHLLPMVPRSDDLPRCVRGALYRAMQQLPEEVALPLARSWTDGSDWCHKIFGAGMLEHMATVEDLPRLRRLVVESLEMEDWYVLCSALDAMLQVGSLDVTSEVERAYHEAKYSRARTRAANVLLSSTPSRFAEAFAYPCLWDCESATRLLGCQGIRLSRPGALERLRALAEDPREDDDVRDSARTAIQGGQPPAP